jgi:tRNA uridine 5-carboxymethylaminomethyl modification enzyme
LGRRVGLVSDERWERYRKKQDEYRQGAKLLVERKLKPSNRGALSALGLSGLRNGVTLEELLRRPEIGIDALVPLGEGLAALSPEVLEQLEIATKYEGYIQRQLEQVARFREMEDVKIPAAVNYLEVEGLSAEVRERLLEIRPETLGQAGRIQGVTPAALAVLNVHLRKKR